MIKENLKYVLKLIIDCFILSGILLYISQYKDISLVWILSPFWIYFSIILIEILLTIISSICSLIFIFLKYLFRRRKHNDIEK